MRLTIDLIHIPSITQYMPLITTLWLSFLMNQIRRPVAETVAAMHADCYQRVYLNCATIDEMHRTRYNRLILWQRSVGINLNKFSIFRYATTTVCPCCSCTTERTNLNSVSMNVAAYFQTNIEFVFCQFFSFIFSISLSPTRSLFRLLSWARQLFRILICSPLCVRSRRFTSHCSCT